MFERSEIVKIKYNDLVEYRCDKCRKVEVPEGLYVTENNEELCDLCILNRYKTVAQLELTVKGGCDEQRN